MATTSMPRLWPGATVVCLGSGPSLTRADVVACQGRARVIAVNDAWRLAPEADVLYSSDEYWWRHYRGVPEFGGLKVTLGRRLQSPAWATALGLTVLGNTGDTGLERQPTGLRNGRNSGYAAINLAVHLGASRILLLGYDMGLAGDGRGHFFGAHPPGLRNSNAALYQLFRRRFETLIAPLAAAGVTVVNCSRETALTTFPCVTLETALAREVAA